MKRRDFHPFILWITHPTQVDCLELLPADLVCYDCVDNWPDFSGDKRREEIMEKEIRLLSRADVVFVTSRALLRRIQNHARNAYLVPNGVEAEHFSLVIQRGLPIPEDMRNLKRPVIGYVGAVAEWLDFDLIAYAAQRKKDFSFVFIGPLLGVKEARYRHITNLHFLNTKPYQVLPNYMKQMDVMILPFKINELTKSVDPVKAYEYLAAGKQVVATNMPELCKFGNLVKIARNKQQ
ncbi:glycosyltransferase, partial [Candidatus Pacearchaeota archaeon]|nr:glycosyltransferase [Candidatus Pacearchaeota archaeon]